MLDRWLFLFMTVLRFILCHLFFLPQVELHILVSTSREIKEKKANQLWSLLSSLSLECSNIRNVSALCVQLWVKQTAKSSAECFQLVIYKQFILISVVFKTIFATLGTGSNNPDKYQTWLLSQYLIYIYICVYIHI